MKKELLVTGLLLFVLSQLCLAQDPSEAPAAKPAHKAFSLVYFSELLGPAVSGGDGFIPSTDGRGNKLPGTDGYNVWNQLSFRYKFENGWEPFFNPRFTWTFGDRSRLGQDDGPFRTEDPVVGVRKMLFSQGAWSFFAQMGYRVPMSRFTRDSNWQGQVECFCILDWSPNKEWSFGAWMQPRVYVPTGETTTERWRFYFAPYFRRRLGDRPAWLQGFLEQELQHNNPRGEQAYNYATRTLNSAYLGVEFEATNSLIFYPFLRAFDLAKPSWQTTAVGFWTIILAY